MAIGRPTGYKPEYDNLAYNYCLLGAIDRDLADFFGVTEQSINNWKNTYPSFFESIKRGKDLADMKVAESLHKRATGYDQPTDKIFQYQGDPVVVPTVEHVQPDPTAAIFWLKNRQPTRWRDKQEISVRDDTPPPDADAVREQIKAFLAGLTEAERAAIAADESG